MREALESAGEPLVGQERPALPRSLLAFGCNNTPPLAAIFSVDAVVDRVTRSAIASTNREYPAGTTCPSKPAGRSRKCQSIGGRGLAPGTVYLRFAGIRSAADRGPVFGLQATPGTRSFPAFVRIYEK